MLLKSQQVNYREEDNLVSDMIIGELLCRKNSDWLIFVDVVVLFLFLKK